MVKAFEQVYLEIARLILHFYEFGSHYVAKLLTIVEHEFCVWYMPFDSMNSHHQVVYYGFVIFV